MGRRPAEDGPKGATENDVGTARAGCPYSPECVEKLFENSWTGSDRVFLVTQSADKGASRPVLKTHRTSEWSPFGFSKQFRKGNSANFALRGFSEVCKNHSKNTQFG